MGRGVAVGDEDERIADHAVAPADHSLGMVEDSAPVAAGKEIANQAPITG
jgi:hypothetical protein